MPIVLSTIRSTGRLGVRIAAIGALAVGLLVSAPTTNAHAAASGAAAKAGHLSPHARATARRVGRAVHIAANQKGDPYAYGASGPSRFDCSGLTFYSYRKAGFRNIPRTSSAQAHFAKRISRSHMRRGDLIFFRNGGGVYHVGVYAGRRHGHRMVLHAARPGTRVRTDRVWTNGWFPGTLRHR
jgi:cell wall-associated NlpC family hydrolase